MCAYKFREIHISENSHDDCRLRLTDTHSLLRAERPQHWQDVAKTEVVMNLRQTKWQLGVMA